MFKENDPDNPGFKKGEPSPYPQGRRTKIKEYESVMESERDKLASRVAQEIAQERKSHVKSREWSNRYLHNVMRYTYFMAKNYPNDLLTPRDIDRAAKNITDEEMHAKEELDLPGIAPWKFARNSVHTLDEMNAASR